MNQIQNQRAEARKTVLKKRCNYIINQLLSKIDPSLVNHFKKVDTQPIILLVKWIRCFFAREGSIPSVFCLWDYLFSIISDNFKNLDYLCMAVLQYKRQEFFGCREMSDVMLVLQGITDIEDPYTFIEVSQRINKIERDVTQNGKSN